MPFIFLLYTRPVESAAPLGPPPYLGGAARTRGGGRAKQKRLPEGASLPPPPPSGRSARRASSTSPRSPRGLRFCSANRPRGQANPRKFYQRRIAAFPRGGVPGSFEESIVQKSIRQLGWRILFCTLSHAVGQRSSVSLFEIQGGDVRRFSSGKWCFLGGETKDNKQRRSIPTMRFLILPLQTPERFFQNRLHSCRVLQTDTVVNKGYFL